MVNYKETNTMRTFVFDTALYLRCVRRIILHDSKAETGLPVVNGCAKQVKSEKAVPILVRVNSKH